MDAHVKNALHNTLQYFATVEEQDFNSIETELTATFDADLPFMDKVSQLDETFDNHPRFEELREYVFDLLMINFFAEDVQKLEEDYLDSEEWEAIEEDTLDRGSELLNVLLYLKECEDADVEEEDDDDDAEEDDDEKISDIIGYDDDDDDDKEDDDDDDKEEDDDDDNEDDDVKCD